MIHNKTSRENFLSAFERKKAFSAFEKYDRWVRGFIGNETIIDSKNVMMLWRENYLSPIYCFHFEDVEMERLTDSDRKQKSDQFGEMHFWHLSASGKTIKNAAWTYIRPPEPWKALKNYIMFNWESMDRWFEESEEVFVHPRDPYHRVDVIPSSRMVEVRIGKEVIAKSNRTMFLFETGLPTRYYFPMEDVSMELLEPTDTLTKCPYKGTASYWSVSLENRTYKDIVWGYMEPKEECIKIKGLVSFYNEKVDVFVDGIQETRAPTPWS